MDVSTSRHVALTDPFGAKIISILFTGGGADMALLQEDLIDVMPAVEEANSISEELDKKVKFEIILISPHMLGKMQGQAKADVRTF